MASEFPLVMPKMSMTMETGELLSWMKAVGDAVKAGDVVAEVQTDKIDMEVESPVDGVIARILVEPGSHIEVGSPLAYILSESEDLMAGLFDSPTQGKAEPTTPGSDVPHGMKLPAVRATPVSRRGPLPAVPFARRRATELHVSLADVTGSGPNGAITVNDVERAATAAQLPAAAVQPTTAMATQPLGAAVAPPTPTVDVPRRGPVPDVAPPVTSTLADPGFAADLTPRRKSIRSAVARTMTASAAIPQFTVFAELNLEPLSLVRQRVGWTTLLLRGLSRVLRQYPVINAGWDDPTGAPAAPQDQVGIALATDTAVGLLAPVVRDVDLLSLAEQDALVRAMVDKARIGKLSGADILGATTTLSNLGGFGVPSFTSLLTPGQATALSVGTIATRPVVIGGGLAPRLGATVGLTLDHRAVDGADGARLLADLTALFNHPEDLMS